MAIGAGRKLDAVDFTYPDVVTAFGNGTNTITSATFAVMPSTTCTASITNPHPSADMLCQVSYGAWMNASAGDVRLSVDISGAVTIAAGIGGGAAIGWGEIPIVSLPTGATNSGSQQRSAMVTVELPPGTTTFKAYGLRTGAGTTQINYPTIRLEPVQYLF